jgi:hypothetical protein
MSIACTGWPVRLNNTARAAAVVVFAVPPFWFPMVKTFM